MIIRLIGSGMILFGCASFGVLISQKAKNEISALRNFVIALEYMECELQYRVTPLPDLCRQTGAMTKGSVSKLFYQLSRELESQISPNVSICMASAVNSIKEITPQIAFLSEELGDRLGIFDLDGQVRVLQSIRHEAQSALEKCEKGHEVRSRSCKTIAVCAGAAIVILLI